jgi:hypothetical protein
MQSICTIVNQLGAAEAMPLPSGPASIRVPSGADGGFAASRMLTRRRRR